MDLKKQYKQLIKNDLAKYFLAKGYTQKKQYFYKLKGDLTFSYAFHIENGNETDNLSFNILVGVNSAIFDKTIGRKPVEFPIGYDNLLSQTTFQLFNSEQDTYFEILPNSDLVALTNQILTKLDKVELFLQKIKTSDHLVDYSLKYNHLVHHEDLFKYFIITNDEIRLKKYLKVIKRRLKFIVERTYSNYIGRVEKLKLELNSENNV